MSIRKFLIVAAACMAFAASGGEEADGKAPLVLVTTGTTAPYSYIDAKTGEVVGLEIDIAREAAAKLGRKLEVRIDKFPALLPLVHDGKADLAASGITITEGRSQTVDFSEPYATEGGMFLYRAGEPMPNMVSAMHLRVAVMDASTYDFYLSLHDIDPIRFDSFPLALEAFLNGKVDTVFYDSCTLRIVAVESGGKLAISRLETREKFGIAVQKGNTELKAALDEFISARRAGK